MFEYLKVIILKQCSRIFLLTKTLRLIFILLLLAPISVYASNDLVIYEGSDLFSEQIEKIDLIYGSALSDIKSGGGSNIKDGSGYSTVTGKISFLECFDAESTCVLYSSDVNLMSQVSSEQKKIRSSKDIDAIEKDESLYFILAHNIRAKIEPNLQGYGIDTLSDDGRSIYQDGENPKFLSTCGTHYIRRYIKSATLLMMVGVHFDTLHEKERFNEYKHNQASHFLSFDSFAENINSIVTKDKIKGKVTVRAIQRGGDPTKLSRAFSGNFNGQYHFIGCTVANMNDCVDAVHHMYGYSVDTFPQQISCDRPETMLSLGLEYTDLICIEDLGLSVKYVENSLEKAKKEVEETIKRSEEYHLRISESVDNYPWDKNNDFYENMLFFLEESKKNIDSISIVDTCSTAFATCVDVKNKLEPLYLITETDMKEFPTIEDYDNYQSLSEFLNLRGDEYYEKGIYTKASSFYNKALKLDDEWIIENRELVKAKKNKALAKRKRGR